MVRIKICGLTNSAEALAAACAGVDYLGMVFASSRRQVTTARGQEIADAVRALHPRPALVGVFANNPIYYVNQIVRECRLDYAQLSGDENPAYCRRVEVPVIKAVHIRPHTITAEVMAEIENGYSHFTQAGLTFLLDTAVPSLKGGTGRVFDWRVAMEAAARFPVMIAGGLNSDNIAEMIKMVRPWGVDVSSGVERSGGKDPAMIKEFVSRARAFEKAAGKE
jgi:phosphoribosylanthranilate isomerase